MRLEFSLFEVVGMVFLGAVGVDFLAFGRILEEGDEVDP